MDSPLPSNQALINFSKAVPWQKIESFKETFNTIIQSTSGKDSVDLETLSKKLGILVTALYDSTQTDKGNVILGEYGGKQFILGSVVSSRYRSGKSLMDSIIPYNLNPSVNHTNIEDTPDKNTRMRAIGAELELGLLREDGTGPTLEEMDAYIERYTSHARRLGITPQIDREACQYQIETHVAPGIGYHRTRSALDGIMTSLTQASKATGLYTAILSCYPVESDFKLSNDAKVQTAVDLMVEINEHFSDYKQRIRDAKEQYHLDEAANAVQVFRLQGCHIHLDVAGRSEGLALLTFHTMLRSATAIANSAVLKGGPFVNGTCDEHLLCTRERLRQTTATGRHIAVPCSPHLTEGDLGNYGDLLYQERANAVARGLLYEDGLGSPISVMHNGIGRIRPDLRSSKRICTVESTGMPVNVSASRQAAVLTDFEYTHALVEDYFRKHGCDLGAMFENEELWAIIGPLDTETFQGLQNQSDQKCTDIVLKTATGTEMTLAEFYELKRIYFHKHMPEQTQITPRDIDDVYMSLQRMLVPPSGQTAQTIEEYIYDYKLRSTGNWGQILRNAFIEAGGTPGTHNPNAVLQVTKQVHNALYTRYTNH